jgi:class 3 adenylate cyclase
MMFTDIVNSTAIKAEIGDQEYFNEVLGPHNALVRESVEGHMGHELKAIGDAFLIGFANPGDACACAAEIQTELGTRTIGAGSAQLRVRIGVHTGIPIIYRDAASGCIDLSGTDVDKAARIESLAHGGQVLISEETRTFARPQVHDWGLWELKGLNRHRIFELLWPGRVPERPAGRPALGPGRFLTRFVGREAELSVVMDSILAAAW